MIYTKPVLKKKVQINILQFFRAKNGLAVRCLMIIATRMSVRVPCSKNYNYQYSEEYLLHDSSRKKHL